MTLPADLHERVKVADLKPGDTILMDGVLKTVSPSALKRDALMGATLWGDSHKLGRNLITRVTFGAEIARRKTQ